MKRKPRRSLMSVLVLILCSFLAMEAFAFNHYAIDVDALKELTAADTFEVKITKKTVVDKVSTDLSSPSDMLTLTVENGSGRKVDSLKVMIVCYDEEHLAAQLASSGLPTLSAGHEKRKFRLEEFAPENGQSTTFQINIPCTHSNFTGASALVASYTSDGTEIVNPLAEEWNELALGSPTHILD